METEAIINHDPFIPGRHALVMGLGKSGWAAVQFLHQLGMKVSVSDITPAERLDPEMKLWLNQKEIFLEAGRHSEDLFTRVDCIVVSPGVPLDTAVLEAARRRSIPILGEMAVAARFLKTPVVAVTGTNGKTTVTTLLGDVFRESGLKVFVGGNIGTPLLTYVSGPQEADVVVLEISSFQLDTGGGVNGLRPAIGLLLNISPDHLDRYRSFADYTRSKFRLFAAQQQNDIAIINCDDPEIMRCPDLWPPSRCFFFGRQTAGRPGASLRDKIVVLSPQVSPQTETETYDLAGTALDSEPNLHNGMAVVLAARLMDCPREGISRGLRRFQPLPHRMTQVAEIDGVRYIDDSKATNIGATHAALAALDRPVLLIAGGRDKGGDYTLLKEIIGEKVKLLVLLGEAQEKMATALGMVTAIAVADNMEAAVRIAGDAGSPGDIVLLSPACSSFDMFASYAERGEVFTRAVLARRQKNKGVSHTNRKGL